MTTQQIYIVEGYFRSPDGRFSFHAGETLNRDALIARGLLVPASEGSTEMVETEAMRRALWRNELRVQDEAAPPEGPADVTALMSGAIDPGPAPEPAPDGHE